MLNPKKYAGLHENDAKWVKMAIQNGRHKFEIFCQFITNIILILLNVALYPILGMLNPIIIIIIIRIIYIK